MTIEFTRKQYLEVWRGDQYISRHVSELECAESASSHAEDNGSGIYEIRVGSEVWYEISIVLRQLSGVLGLNIPVPPVPPIPPANHIWDPAVIEEYDAGPGGDAGINGVLPGEIIEIKAGTYTAKRFALIDLAGDPGNRITIRNDPFATEPVVFQHTGDAFEFFRWENCQEFIFDGTLKYIGAPDGELGVTIINNVWTEGRTQAGIIFENLNSGVDEPTGYLKTRGTTQKFVIKGFELDGKGVITGRRSGIGFMAHDRSGFQKDDQFDLLWRDDMIIEKFYIHDLHHESIYLGNNWASGSAILDADPRNCHIQYGISDDCGWGGGQIKGSWDGVTFGRSSINHCACYRCGGEAVAEGDTGHTQGFQITGSNADVYNVLSVDSGGPGITVRVQVMDVGVGPDYSAAQIDEKQVMKTKIWNALVIRNGKNSTGLPDNKTRFSPGIALWVSSNTVNGNTGELLCENNVEIFQTTVVDGDQSSVNAQKLRSVVTTRDVIAAGNGSGGIGIIRDSNGGVMIEVNNLKNTVAANNFLDPNSDNFHLTLSSPAKNGGSASGFPATDIEDITRPQGSDADQGAYELVE